METSPHHRRTTHQFIRCFSAVDFEHELLVRKVNSEKDIEKLAMIKNHKGKLWTLTHNSERLF